MKTYELVDKSEVKRTYWVGTTLLIIGFLLNVAETAYFGWNMTPSSKEEMICDYISKFLITCGVLILVYLGVVFGGTKNRGDE